MKLIDHGDQAHDTILGSDLAHPDIEVSPNLALDGTIGSKP
jgi:hypothetical protein